MTKRPQTPAYDRRAIMAKAHREYAASRRRGDGLTFGYWLAYAWRVARDRRQRDMTDTTMRMIAGIIDDHLSRRIMLAPEIRKGRIYEKDRMGFCISRADNGRRMADERSAVCRSHGAR